MVLSDKFYTKMSWNIFFFLSARSYIPETTNYVSDHTHHHIFSTPTPFHLSKDFMSDKNSQYIAWVKQKILTSKFDDLWTGGHLGV